ncbi:hypothetical protein BC793_1154 [Actinoplanes xinjiangensis]|uniref:Uncharacterized protein n=2 Tax=Actinoplanes xinjiangensis TaxID=512350 RepID=A0A316F601_9ACTN|nr:hypothetical protein BC793_1154 [Actinoplanes xinjiangensis]GIF41057.1 hypothetical protein Axi01nite_53680 [Actinoplanes xinjiangensis]
MGRYCYFDVNLSIHADGVSRFRSSRGSGGNGVIDNEVNTTGGPVQGMATVPSYVVNFPQVVFGRSPVRSAGASATVSLCNSMETRC